ncbi:hypothetical protein PC122_g1966 [Phytophthora cactorum]|nr:hypothetical protein PC122_g1966 [Phytophthora cactorum]
MQADRDAALSWRETFDELLVFEQDFDTAMQILMFQDEKVARLSLEDSQHTRSQRTRSRQEASIRGKTHSPSRKRQRVELDATPRPEPPPFPTPQTQEEPFTPSTTQSDGHSKQLSSGTKAGSAGDRAGSSVDVLGVGRGDGTGTGLVASLFSTGSGKRVSISKAKLDTYEKQMCDDDSDVLAPSSARTDGHSKQLSSGTKAGSAGDRAGSSVDVLGVGRGDGTGTGLVASLFSTGSGKQVSISKAKLDAYERQMCDDDSNVLAPSSARTDGHSKQLSSGTKAGSAGDRAGSSVDVLGVGRGDGTGTGLVASLFSTGSGKRVSISKAKLDAYERQMCDDDSDVLAPLITLTEGDALKLGAEVKGDHSENTTSSRDLSSIVNRSRDTAVPIEREVEQGVESVVGYLANKSATLMRGSGKMVVISAPRPHTCEGESGAGSGIECNGSCTNMVQRIATEVIVEDVSEGASTSRRLEKTGLAERKVCGERGDPRDRMILRTR